MDNQQKKVLIIEDEKYVRELYERILTTAGFKVLTAENGAKGVNIAFGQQDPSFVPQLIILDIMLPDVNGIEVLKKIRSNSNFEHTPIIILTNLGQENVIKEAFMHNAQGYIIKANITPEQLVEYVQKTIAK